jgi:rare lipoprotein A
LKSGRILFVAFLVVLVSACSSRGPRYYQDDGPHSRVPADLDKIADAVPRAEPLSASGNSPYVVFGKRYVPLTTTENYRQRGVASWYGRKFHGRRTSSGEKYDMYAMTAAHKTLPLPSFVKVRNLDNNREVIVRVNDRGPFLHNRLIDLSYAAAHRLGVIKTGTARVEVTAVGPGNRVTGTGVAIGTVDTSPENPEARPLNTPNRMSPISQARAEPAQPAGRGVFLQVGSFSIWDNAIKLRDRLENSGIRPIEIATVTVNSKRYFRVRVGPVENLGETERINDKLRHLGIDNGRVIIE